MVPIPMQGTCECLRSRCSETGHHLHRRDHRDHRHHHSVLESPFPFGCRWVVISKLRRRVMNLARRCLFRRTGPASRSEAFSMTVMAPTPVTSACMSMHPDRGCSSALISMAMLGVSRASRCLYRQTAIASALEVQRTPGLMESGKASCGYLSTTAHLPHGFRLG